jgi:hypothetical protein
MNRGQPNKKTRTSQREEVLYGDERIEPKEIIHDDRGEDCKNGKVITNI